MRDKARIKIILKKLEKLWNNHPDQRLGQLLENYVFDSEENRGIATMFLFYQEDNKTEEILDTYMEDIEK